MITVATIGKLAGTVVAIGGAVAMWNGYIINENEEVLNNYQQGEALKHVIGTHQRDKVILDLAINEITITIYEDAVDGLNDGQTMSTAESRKYSEAITKKARWEVSLEIAETYLDVLRNAQ